MVPIPAGRFIFGMSLEAKRQAAEREAVHPDMLHFHTSLRELDTPSFWMDRHPVTRGQFLRFLRATGHSLLYNGWLVGWKELVDVERLDDPAQLWCPMVGVNSADAQAYAAWLGKRLPTEVEWEKAARGPDDRLFPWGHDMRRIAPPDGMLTLDSLRSVGSRPDLASPYGVHDMKGLVLEWVKIVFPPVSKNGHRNNQPFQLAGSSLLHRFARSHMIPARLNWHPDMRIYNAGFRCVSDKPPARLTAFTPPVFDGIRQAGFRRDLYAKAPIQLIPTDHPTFFIRVPWFPESLWVVDFPETAWGPYGGANDWPQGNPALWKTAWKSSQGGTHLGYSRQQGDQALEVDISADGNRVLCRVSTRRLPPVDFSSICIKTFSPFFSSQEKATQFRIEGEALRGAAQMSLAPDQAASFGWTVGHDLPHGAVITRSFDGSAFVAILGPDGGGCWGNGWPHCTHVTGPVRPAPQDNEIRLLFFMGSLPDLLRELPRL